MSDYTDQRARDLQLRIRAMLRELPNVCFDFINAIDSTTQPLTRYAYVIDLKLFFGFLTQELPQFADKAPNELDASDLAKVSSRDIYMYLDYLSLYMRDDVEITNQELGKLRKISSLRSFYKFLYKNGYIDSDPAALVDMPKRHQKPIIRLEIDEVARMLDLVESGAQQTEHQKKYNAHTRARDLAILTLFLGTGIRVSELVGINIDDIDFSINGFLVTRKGGNQAILYFPDEVAQVLKDYLKVRLEMTPIPGHEEHYNKYGAFLQAAKVAELIRTAGYEEKANGEYFNFSGHILDEPREFIDPSNLMSKSTVASLEALFESMNVTNPNRTYADPNEVVKMIDDLASLGEVTAENHLELLAECEEIRAKYDALNVDDRDLVTNLAILEQYEKDIADMIIACRPEPIKTVIFNADTLTQDSYTSTVLENGFTLVGTADKKMDKKSSKVTFTYAGETYTTTYGLSVGGSAKFGSYRYVSFEVEGPCTVTIAVKSSGSDARVLNIADSSNAVVGSYEAGTSVTVSSVDLDAAGTYSVGSAGSGMYIYAIIIEYFE